MQRRRSIYVWMCFGVMHFGRYIWMHFGRWYGVSVYLSNKCTRIVICFRFEIFSAPLQWAYSCSWYICSLGKTLQSITLLFTLLYQGFDGKPMVKKAIIVTPTSLVSNWEAEIKKWVGERVQLVALCESTRDDVVSGIERFTSPRSSLQASLYTEPNSFSFERFTDISSFPGTYCFIRDIPNAFVKIWKWILWPSHLWWGSQVEKWSDNNKSGIKSLEFGSSSFLFNYSNLFLLII